MGARSGGDARHLVDDPPGCGRRVLGADDGPADDEIIGAAAQRLGGSREIESYLASGEWEGKAGGYAIQGRAGALVRSINGSYSNVVGLPLCETAGLLAAAGVRPGAP